MPVVFKRDTRATGILLKLLKDKPSKPVKVKLEIFGCYHDRFTTTLAPTTTTVATSMCVKIFVLILC